MQKLAGIGMFGKVNSTLLATLTSEQADLLRQEMGARGTSLESSVIKDCRDRYKRAKRLEPLDLRFCISVVSDLSKKPRLLCVYNQFNF